MDGTLERRLIWQLCQDCAAEIYGRTPPSERYADVVARMLFGTAAQESGLTWRRQRSLPWPSDKGGFSLWQVELRASVHLSVEYLRRREDVLARATDWLWRDPHASRVWLDMPEECWPWLLRGWDRLGCLMARLHYMRVQAPIPATVEEQAEYWLRYYNGGGVLRYRPKPAALREYVDNWWEFCEPVLAAG